MGMAMNRHGTLPPDILVRQYGLWMRWLPMAASMPMQSTAFHMILTMCRNVFNSRCMSQIAQSIYRNMHVGWACCKLQAGKLSRRRLCSSHAVPNSASSYFLISSESA